MPHFFERKPIGMSELHRAIRDEIDAFTPDRTPPLSVLMTRKRHSDRRHQTLVATAMSVAAVTAIAGGSALIQRDDIRSPAPPVAAASSEPAVGSEPAPDPATESARRRCAAIAEHYQGAVAGYYPATVAQVREHMRSPSSGEGAELVHTGPFQFPSGWANKSSDAQAAACYIDGTLPVPGPPGGPTADRALILSTTGAEPILVMAGPRESITPAPLPAVTEQTVTLPTSRWTPGSGANLALMSGVVSVRRDGDALCVVLGFRNAREITDAFTPIIWPQDYTATAFPLEVRDPAGQVVAREGQALSFGGSGATPVEAAAPCMFGRDSAASVMKELPALSNS